MLAGVLGLLALFFLTMPVAGPRQRRLARKRRTIDAAGFETLMARAGVTSTTARYLWKELGHFYHHPLTPMPDDRLESLIMVDRPEIEGLVTRFWQAMRGGDTRPTSTLQHDPSVAELGRHSALIAGWHVRGTA